MDLFVCGDSHANGQVGAPLAILISNSDYPIYAVDVLEQSRTNSNNKLNVSNCVAVGGGRERQAFWECH